MDRKLREKITQELRDETKSQVELPKGFLFEKAASGICMRFQSEDGMGLGDTKKNMQEDAAAFEAWALAIYVHCLHGKGKVCLEIPDGVSWDLNDLYKYPHYSRFLYRVLRFSEQHPWLDISASKRLGKLAGNF